MESVKGTMRVKEVSYLAIVPVGAWEQDEDFGTVTIKLESGKVQFVFTTERLDTTKPLKLILEASLA